MRKRSITGLAMQVLVLGLACLTSDFAQAQAFPTKGPIRIVVPYPPGTPPDVGARLVGEAAGKILGQTIIYENKPGAGALTAAETVVRSTPDGYTLLAADVTVWAIDKFMFKTLPFDPDTDLLPLTMLNSQPIIMITRPKFPNGDGTWADLVAEIKANPGKYKYGSAGIGSILHFAGAMMEARLGADMRHIPYRGGATLPTALIGNEVDIVFGGHLTAPLVLAAGGRVVGVADIKRAKLYPDVPTFKELGIPDFVFVGATGLMAPKGTPPAVLEKLTDAFRRAAREPLTVTRLAEAGSEAVGGSTEDFVAHIKTDKAVYGEAAKAAKIEPQ